MELLFYKNKQAKKKPSSGISFNFWQFKLRPTVWSVFQSHSNKVCGRGLRNVCSMMIPVTSFSQSLAVTKIP
jgi:hypothetical protein